MNVRSICFAPLLVALSSTCAFAIPTNPDPIHTAAATPWPNPLPGGFNPAVDRHQHWNADPIDGVAGKFSTYSVWDDNVYRYGRLTPTQGHGFMQNAASFEFAATVPAAAAPIFAGNVVNNWQGAVNGFGVNSNNHPVQTLINFLPAGQGVAGDFLIQFAAKYPVEIPNPNNPNAPPMYGEQSFPSPGEIQPDGTWPGNPGNPGGGPGGGSEGVLAYWTPGLKVLTFNSLVPWYYFDPMVNPTPGQFDFWTTALHEFGHVIGLDHEGVAGSVMFPSQSAYITNGMGGSMPRNATTQVRFLDLDTNIGSKVLYTIAVVPEPTSLALLTIATLLATSRRRRT